MADGPEVASIHVMPVSAGAYVALAGAFRSTGAEAFSGTSKTFCAWVTMSRSLRYQTFGSTVAFLAMTTLVLEFHTPIVADGVAEEPTLTRLSVPKKYQRPFVPVGGVPTVMVGPTQLSTDVSSVMAKLPPPALWM